MEVRIPRENANDDQVLIVEIHRSSGDIVETGEVLISFETSKAIVDVTSPCDGTITYEKTIHKDNMIAVDEVFCVVGESMEDCGDNSGSLNTIPMPADSKPLDSGLASDELSDVFIVSEEASRLLKQGLKPKRNSKWLTSKDFVSAEKAPQYVHRERQEVNVVESELRSVTKLISNRKKLEIAALNKNSTYLNSTIGINLEVEKRRVSNLVFDGMILDLIVYETSNLLRKLYQDLNSYYRGDGEVGLYDQVVPGVAFDSVSNLTVVSLTSIQTLNDVQSALCAVISRFDENSLKSTDLLPTTFTVSDLSSADIDFVLPLINGHQAFILGITKSVNGFHIYGTFDHRVSEGKRFSAFLAELKRRVELYFSVGENSYYPAKECFYCSKTLHEEKSMGNRGLIKLDDESGEKLICRTCFEGW